LLSTIFGRHGARREKRVRIALVQTNPVIGDFTGNCQKIVDQARRAEKLGCALAVFPELAVAGYPPQDLLERQSFIAAQGEALRQLLEQLPSTIDVLLGTLEPRREGKGKGLYNSAVVIRGKQIVFTARKQLLPSYDVFDERRYFEPGSLPDLYQLGGLRFAVTVCEDVWNEEVAEYDHDPVADLFSRAASDQVQIDALINISASPFQRGKERQRKSIFRAISRRYKVPFLYCNQVGGQDSLLFDGRSLVLNGAGDLVAQARGFAEDLLVVDSEGWLGAQHAPAEVDETAAVYQALVMGVGDYLHKSGFTSAVLGLSGGIDSALTAAIAAEALGPKNLLGVALPSAYSSAASLEDARNLAANLGCRFEVLPISPLLSSFQKSLAGLFAGLAEDLTEQNLQARIRGNLLMALSNKFGHLLLTTGNKSEMAVGYCTLYGDMSGGLAVIADLPKGLVYELARHVNRNKEIIPRRSISRAPSAELKPDQTDQDDLPPYEILDEILELHLEQGMGRSELLDRGFSPSVVDDTLRRIRLNEYKRKQAPIGLKVTTKAFGFGRRYPNVQRFHG
jgi:NAD+ synthetase